MAEMVAAGMEIMDDADRYASSLPPSLPPSLFPLLLPFCQ